MILDVNNAVLDLFAADKFNAIFQNSESRTFYTYTLDIIANDSSVSIDNLFVLASGYADLLRKYEDTLSAKGPLENDDYSKCLFHNVTCVVTAIAYKLCNYADPKTEETFIDPDILVVKFISYALIYMRSFIRLVQGVDQIPTEADLCKIINKLSFGDPQITGRSKLNCFAKAAVKIAKYDVKSFEFAESNCLVTSDRYLSKIIDVLYGLNRKYETLLCPSDSDIRSKYNSSKYFMLRDRIANILHSHVASAKMLDDKSWYIDKVFLDRICRIGDGICA